MSTPERQVERNRLATLQLWRVFPWDTSAKSGARFSPSHVPPPTGRGRFDLPREISRVLYLAESPEHAVAEMIQPWRGQRIGAAHLARAMLPLALVRVSVATSGNSFGVTGTPSRSSHRERQTAFPSASRSAC